MPSVLILSTNLRRDERRERLVSEIPLLVVVQSNRKRYSSIDICNMNIVKGLSLVEVL